MAEDQNIAYFHGLPGSGDELALFDKSDLGAFDAIFVPDRNDNDTNNDVTSYMDCIARQVERRFPHGPIRLIGFSLGAFIALQIAARLQNRIGKIDLVSAAAPLSLGDFLDDMAGESVFQTAQSSPFLFSLLVRLQSWAARWVPAVLVKAVFAKAAGQDRELAIDPAFQKGMAVIIGHSLGQNARTYQREIAFYVSDWAAILQTVTQPVTLWQGEDDNWTPPAMADALQRALPNVVARHDLKRHSHYSTLRHFLKQGAGIMANKP